MTEDLDYEYCCGGFLLDNNTFPELNEYMTKN